MNPVGKPQVGDWYEDEEKGETFQVVSVDAASGTVQIQSFDGDLDSIEAEDWDEMPLASKESHWRRMTMSSRWPS